MTFEFSPDQQQFLAQVRETVTRIVSPASGLIDQSGQIPDGVLNEIATAVGATPGVVYRPRSGGAALAAAVVVELAIGSAAVGAHVGMGSSGP